MDEETQKKLLAIARRTVEAAVKGENPPEFYLSDPDLQAFRGAFVTIKKRGQLRGCIGQFVAQEPLYQVVRNMAISSATQDPRFFNCRLTPADLPEIDIEISVLSQLSRIANPLDPSRRRFPRPLHGLLGRGQDQLYDGRHIYERRRRDPSRR